MLFLSRIRIRFSLHTLLFAVLAIAAAGTFWKNRAPWRLERVFPGIGKEGWQEGLSPDGKWFCVAYLHDRTESGEPSPSGVNAERFIVWNTETGRSFTIHHPKIEYGSLRAKFSPDSSRIIVLSGNELRKASVWDLKTASEVKIPGLNAAELEYARFCSNGNRVLLQLSTGYIVLSDLLNQTVLSQHPGKLSGESVPLGTTYVMTDWGGAVRVYDVKTGREVRYIAAHNDWVLEGSQYYSPSMLIAWGIQTEHAPWEFDFSVCFDLKKSELPDAIEGHLKGMASDESLAVFQVDREFRIVDLRTQKILSKNAGYSDSYIFFSKNNSHVFSLADAAAYDTSTGTRIYQVDSAKFGIPAPDRSHFVCWHEWFSDVTIHDMSNGELLQTLKNEVLPFYDYDRQAFTPDSKHFITRNTKSNDFHLWTRYRPAPWWGLAFIPEFWILLALILSLLWSLRADRRSATTTR